MSKLQREIPQCLDPGILTTVRDSSCAKQLYTGGRPRAMSWHLGHVMAPFLSCRTLCKHQGKGTVKGVPRSGEGPETAVHEGNGNFPIVQDIAKTPVPPLAPS